MYECCCTYIWNYARVSTHATQPSNVLTLPAVGCLYCEQCERWFWTDRDDFHDDNAMAPCVFDVTCSKCRLYEVFLSWNALHTKTTDPEYTHTATVFL